jgi:hypothetical protein
MEVVIFSGRGGALGVTLGGRDPSFFLPRCRRASRENWQSRSLALPVVRGGRRHDPPLWTVVPNKALSLSPPVADVTAVLFVNFKRLCVYYCRT